MLTKYRIGEKWLGYPQSHRWSAIADVLQSSSGLILGLFLLAHLHFESTILLGKEAFYRLANVLEGGWFTSSGHGSSLVTQTFSMFMLLVLVVHAVTALRRFPAQMRQWQALRNHNILINHQDSRLWFWQMITGFMMFFLVPMHLVTMITNPEIGPHLSAERVWHDNYWLVYIVLLPAVVIHAMLGLYRLALKWGVSFRREGLRTLAKVLIGYLIVLGLCSLTAYLVIGRGLTTPVTPFIP
ncbi:fumarate reductase cytochrome b subunit [Shewanella yunxiaonensis]|uniref:Fumarate reductase cytochrome b subunit n=1 Tax=Shewanella yunxiaonensis TaxID=2829809 RepID=A0ABX7YU28_9GAMM|nr:fumarate reductase cytochrome b subunit [Shewanella yunxiaonensis]QUN06253.1 fumarate reductase cytochrome b subunit [Shewanella yunxiaonensis]